MNCRKSDDRVPRRRHPILSVLAGCLFIGTVSALSYADTDSSETIDIPQDTTSHSSPADSLRHAIQQLRSRAAALRKQAAEPNDSTSAQTDTRPEPSAIATEVPAPAKDTVELLSRESTDAFLKSLTGRRRSTRERGFGGAFGPVMGIYALNMKPVDELLDYMKTNAAFSNARIAIDKPYAFFQFGGICGYGAVGNGLRIGGVYNRGSRSYTTYFNDTTYNIEISPSFGGFLIEKALVLENVNLFFGGLIGGGNIRVRPSKATNAFTSISVGSNENRTNFNELNARSLLVEAHGGFTYTMIKWFHIGAELSAPLLFSQSGFVTPGEHSITNGFISISPGIRIRIMIGNIG